MALCTSGSVTPLSALKTMLALDLAVAEARLVEQVEGGLALRAGQLELGVEGASDRAREHESADQGHDPGDEHPAPASVHRSSESFEHGGGTSRSSGSGGPTYGPRLRPLRGDRSLQSPPANRGRAEGEERTKMAYQSLYRKYRPQRFTELVGQTHVTAAVRNAVRDGRVGHAYLFSGPRGTGKTTMRAHPGQGAQLHRPKSPTATRAACARTASGSPTVASSICSSSTPRRTTASTPSATSPRACTSVSAPRRRTRCTSSTKCTC